MQSIRNSERYTREAKDIVKLLRTRYVNDKGILIMGRHNNVVSTEEIIDDFGDVAPFLALYGGEDICSRHIEYLQQVEPYKKFKKAFQFTDLVLGLIWYADFGERKRESLDLAVKIIRSFEDCWQFHDGFASTKINGFRIPVTNGMDTTFIEVYTELARATSSDHYASSAIRMAESFEEVRTLRGPLVPVHFFTGPLKFLQKFPVDGRGYKLMKDNTNYLFGLLDLYRITQNNKYLDIADEIINEMHSLFTNRKLCNQGKEGVELTPSFAIVDVCCDAFALTQRESYLNFARELADFWILQQAEKTKLFPLFSGQTDSYLDCETDMAVAFLKLAELSDEVRYKSVAIEVVDGILMYHRHDDGFTLSVNVFTGVPISINLKTKFQALFIKVLHALASDTTIYNSRMFTLLKDR